MKSKCNMWSGVDRWPLMDEKASPQDFPALVTLSACCPFSELWIKHQNLQTCQSTICCLMQPPFHGGSPFNTWCRSHFLLWITSLLEQLFKYWTLYWTLVLLLLGFAFPFANSLISEQLLAHAVSEDIQEDTTVLLRTTKNCCLSLQVGYFDNTSVSVRNEAISLVHHGWTVLLHRFCF